MKKKILFIDQANIIGGAELFTTDLVNNLPNTYEIHVLTSKNETYINMFHKNINIHTMEFPGLKPITLKTIAKYFIAKSSITKKVERIQPDIMVSNTVRAHILCTPISKRIKTKLIWMVHDDTFPSWILKKLIATPVKILTCSKYIKEQLQKKVAKKYHQKISVLFNGIDLKKIPEKKIIDNKQITVGMIGRIVPWKGQRECIEAAEKVRDKINNIQFQIIGNVENTNESRRYREKLIKLIKKKNLQDNVIFIEKIKDILSKINQLDILVHASIKPEPFGRVIMEGMACGVSVIASNLGGTSEIITNGIDGFLIDVKNTQDFADKIMELIKNNQRKKTLQENAFKKIKEKFDLKKTVNNFMQYIDHIQ